MKYLILPAVFICLLSSVQAQWNLQGLGYTQSSIVTGKICVIDQNVVWTTGEDLYGMGYIHYFSRTSDGGSTWTPNTFLQTSSAGFFLLSAVSYDTAWIIKYDTLSSLYKTTDGGLSWAEQFPCCQGPKDSYFWNANEGICIGYRCGPPEGYFEFTRTYDGGITWSRVDSVNIPLPVSYGEIPNQLFVSGNRIWVCTLPNKRLLKSNDKGLHWSLITNPFQTITGPKPLNCYFRDSIHGISYPATPNNNYIAETADGGNTWSTFTPSGPWYLGASWVTGSNNTYISYGQTPASVWGASFSLDGGHTWTDIDTLHGLQVYRSAWADSACGWVSSITQGTNPAATGIWKFKDIIVGNSNIESGKPGLNLYPNPAGDLVNVITTGFSGKEIKLSIFSTSGQKVFEEQYPQQLARHLEKIRLSSMSCGVFILCVQCGTETFRQKFIINR
jgi:photosystem II stability/assembly factor-like uncharacterized protein